MKMPERSPEDGPVTVTILPDDRVLIDVTQILGPHSEHADTIIMSRYNAIRLLGMLSVVLDFPLSKAAGKAIKL